LLTDMAAIVMCTSKMVCGREISIVKSVRALR
jgi:hypothetical protein